MQARNGGKILVPQLALARRLAVTIGAGGVLTLPVLTSFDGGSLSVASGMAMALPELTRWQGGALSLDGSATLSVPGLTNIDDVGLYASGGAVLALPNVRTYQSWNRTWWQALGAGSRVVLAGLTNAVCGSGDWHHIWAQSGGRVELGALAALGAGLTDILADGTDSVVDTGGLLQWTGTRNLNLTARNSGLIDMHTLPSFFSGSVQVLADGVGSVIDLHSLSSFTTLSGPSSLTAQNGGTILLYPNAFLLANVAVNISSGGSGVLPPLLAANGTLALYGTPWRSYWVERLDTCASNAEWQFFMRVALTNSLQVFAPAPQACAAFRVREFVADPPIVDIFRAGAHSAWLVLYGSTNRSFEIEATGSLSPAPTTWEPWSDTGVMTNTFRIFPSFPASDTKRFFRGKQE